MSQIQEELVGRDLLAAVHKRLEKVIGVGEIVVDATLGNGYDALFLARCVGGSGCVIGFDIQEAAVSASTVRLLDAGISPENFQFYTESHGQLCERVTQAVSVKNPLSLRYVRSAESSSNDLKAKMTR